MLNLSELVRGGTVSLGKAGLAVGSNTAKAKILVPGSIAGMFFAIKGLIYYVASTDDAVVLTGSAQTALYTNLYLVCISATNVITVVQGTQVLTADLTAGKSVLEWPEPTANTCPIGAIKVAATSTFTPGTTALGTGNTPTYYDFFAVPDTPITA